MIDEPTQTSRLSLEDLLIDLYAAGVKLWVENGKLRSDAPKGAITPARRSQIKAKRDALIVFLEGANEPNPQQQLRPLRQRPSSQRAQAPLSFAQQRLWFLDQLEPESAFYNIPALIRLTGHLDVVALEQSFQYLIARHESLRTTFDTILSEVGESDPVQVIHEASTFTAQFSLAVIEVADEAEAQQRGRMEATTPFDLQTGPLLRTQLLQIAVDHHILLLTMHHIISDGWSMGVLVNELAQIYAAYGQGSIPTLPDLSLQYADFAVWQRDYLSGERLERQLSFWRDHLKGAPDLLDLPTDYPRPSSQRYRGTHYEFRLKPDLTARLNQLAKSHEATLFMVLLAAFKVLLARYSRQTDLVVGTPIANRNRAEIEGLIGFFVNTLVLRTQLDHDLSFTRLLEQVRQTTLEAYAHQDVPFEQLVNELALERSMSYSPLFQVMFALQTADMGTMTLPQVTAMIEVPEFPFAKFDLTLNVIEQEEGQEAGLLGMFEYATDLFDEATIARMASHLIRLLEGIVKEPEQPVLQLPMLTKAEYHQIVHEWNDTAVDFGEAQTIHALFEEQVERTPDAIALVFEDEHLTYSDLNVRANQLAHHLIDLGVEADTLVAVAMERSIEMVVSLLAVLKAGGAYVPIDPTYPAERIRYMLVDSAAPILLTQSHLSLAQQTDNMNAQDTPDQAMHVMAVDTMAAQLADQLSDNPQTQTSVDDLAYVIYTSGSTGQPKGVLIEQGSLSTHIRTAIDQYQINPTDCILQFASISFDVSLEQMFVAFCSGAKLLLRGNNLWTSEEFDHHLITHGITISNLPPAYCQQLIQHWLVEPRPLLSSSMRLLIVGGDKVGSEMVNLWQKLDHNNIQWLNAYGPTETTITATSFDLEKVSSEVVHIPIGQPWPNRTVYILDLLMQSTPMGVAGELYIGGAGLARGYLNRPDLTAESFIDHPEFGQLYKTGDLCRWLPDGNIEYIGRTDFQVKIRGFRIELGEIEQVLLAQEGVREAVVMAREEIANDKRLVAYIVARGKGQVKKRQTCNLQPATLRQSLAKHLPDYMIPSAFVFLEALPLTPNGKLDCQALPAPEYAGPTQSQVPAETFDETRLVLLWQEVLGVHPIGVTDNFFELGGHSLLATQLVQRMRQTLQRDLSLRQVFASPTIRGLLQGLKEARTATTSFVPLRVGDEPCTPLFLFYPGGGVVFPYLTLLSYLPARQPVYALQARGIYDDLPLFESLEALATQTIQEMKLIQPHGPYTLSGWSFGGMVAFEMARQLRHQGEGIAFLGLIDTYPETDPQAPKAEEPTRQEELQGFFYLLGDIMSVDYRSLDDDLFAQATEQIEPVAWLLDQMSEQGLPPAMDSTIVQRIWVTLKRNSQLMQAYHPQPYDGGMTLFCAEETAPEDGPQRWQALTSQPVDMVWVAGEHATMLNVENVEKLGHALAMRLAGD